MFKKICVITILGILFTGCGNNLIDPQNVSKEELMAGYAAETDDTSQNYEGYSCNTDFSIKPTVDISGQNLRDFKGCGSTASAWKSIVIAKDTSLNRVCVYPAQYIDDKHIYTKPDILQPGKTLFTCVELGSAGPHAAALEYTNVNYNYFYVIEESKKSQMEACLTAGDLRPCESLISKGKFR